MYSNSNRLNIIKVHTVVAILTHYFRLTFGIGILIILLVTFTIPGVFANDINWTGGGDGTTWTQAANWSPQTVPGADDNVFITMPGDYTVILSTTVTINSLVLGGESGTQTLRKTSGTLTINESSSINANGVLVMQAGYIAGSGVLTNQGLIVADAGNWTGINNSTLINEGEIIQERGTFYVAAAGVLENRGHYRIAGDLSMSPSGSMGTLLNTGTFEKTLGTGNATIGIQVDSRPGSHIRSSSGTLRLNTSSTYHDMTFHATSEAAEVILNTGTHTLRGTITGEPTGLITINTSTNAHESGATTQFGGTGLRWTSSYFGEGGTLTNTGTIRIDAPNWAGINGSRILNHGSFIHERGTFYISSAGLFENEESYEISGGSGIQPSGAMGTFLNNGEFIKSGDHLSNVGVFFQGNTGTTVEVANGTLRFTANTQLTNVLLSVPNEDAVLRFHSGIHTFTGDFNSAPAGSIELNSGFRAGGSGARFDITERGLQWTGGWQRNGGVFTNRGLITINSNGTTGARDSRFVNEGSVFVESGGLNLSQQGIFENRGLVEVKANANISSTNTVANPAGSFINDGVFIKSGGENQSVYSANFINRADSEFRLLEGTIRFTLRFSHNEGALFTGRGSIDVATAEFNNRGIIEPGMDSDPLTFIGIYQAADSSAVLRIALGSEASSPPNGLLDVTETSYNVGFRRVGGNAVLGGRLQLDIAGEFAPNDGDEFVIVNTLRGITGGFNATQGLVNEQLGMSFYPVIRNNQLILTAVEGIPVLAGQFSITPGELTAGGLRKVTLAGSGIGPDIRTELVCIDCEDPVNQSVIPGQISNLSNTQADLWFDLTTGKISGDYALRVTDPRGGEISIPVFINEGPLFLSVDVLKQGNGDNRDPGLFVIRTSRVLSEPLTVPYTFGGTAQKFIHFMTDQLGDAFIIPQGQDSLVISVFPVNAGGAFNRNLTLQVQFQQPPASDGFTPPSLFASMGVTGGTASQTLSVFGSSPKRGGNRGMVTVNLAGIGFTQQTSVTISGGNTGLLQPIQTEVNETGTLIKASFNMNGQEIGLRDIIVSNSDDNEILLSGAFAVETAIFPHVNLQILAPPRVPRTRLRTYTIVVTNMGNIDVAGFAALSGLPENIEWDLRGFEIKLSNGTDLNWNQVFTPRKVDDYTVIETPSINLGAGESRKFEFDAAILDPQLIKLVAAWIYL